MRSRSFKGNDFTAWIMNSGKLAHAAQDFVGPEAAGQFMSTRMQGMDAAWIVCARCWEFDPEDFLPAVLSRAGTLLLEFKAPGVKVYHWQRRDAES